jgi:hypothetical protein
MATRAKATQWLKQYPQETNSPNKELRFFIHSRKGRNIFISVTVKEMEAVTKDNNTIDLILLALSVFNQVPGISIRLNSVPRALTCTFLTKHSLAF